MHTMFQVKRVYPKFGRNKIKGAGEEHTLFLLSCPYGISIPKEVRCAELRLALSWQDLF